MAAFMGAKRTQPGRRSMSRLLTQPGPPLARGGYDADDCPHKLHTRSHEMLDAFWQINPRLFGLLPDRRGGQWKIRVRKCASGNAIMVGSEIKMPVDRTSASGTKMKADRPLYSINIPRIDFFWT